MNMQKAALGRREFLLASGTLALVGTIGNQSAQGKALPEGTSILVKLSPTGNPCVRHLEGPDAQSFTALAAAAQQCVTTANACVEYFIGNLGLGRMDSGECLTDGCLAEECLTLAQEVAATCRSVTWLAAKESGHLAKFGGPTADICEACAEICSKLKEDHEPCVHCEAACKRFVRDWYRATETIDYYL